MVRSKDQPGLKDIAAAAGVSVATVSMALAGHGGIGVETRRRIRSISRKLGYRRKPGIGRPRRAATPAVLRVSLVVVGGAWEDESHLIMLRALAVAAEGTNLRVQYQSLPDPRADADLSRRVAELRRDADGLILYGLVGAALLEQLGAVGLPHVVLGHPMLDLTEFPGLLTQVVRADEPAMGEAAARWLLRRGKRIAFICERVVAGLWNDRWLRGYRTALAMAGVAYDPGLVKVTNKLFAGGEPAAAEIAGMRRAPDGYVIPDARVAATFRLAMQSRGVPVEASQIVISGHNQLVESYGMADLPWISYDPNRLAEVAIHQLPVLMARPTPCPVEIIVPFVWRNMGG